MPSQEQHDQEDTITRPQFTGPKERGRPRLEPIRFGEFLCERQLLSDEQLLEALAEHWSDGGRIGAVISRRGFLSPDVVEREAAIYHDLDVVEV